MSKESMRLTGSTLPMTIQPVNRKRYRHRHWRALIRFEQADTSKDLYVIIPSWDLDKQVYIRLSSLPDKIVRMLNTGSIRFHAQVRLGEDKAEDLDIKDWEPR